MEQIERPAFFRQCIDYSIIGYMYIKSLKIKDLQVKLKYHLINEDDDNFSSNHYYIELKGKNVNGDYKIIFDCNGNYNYAYYKNRYAPKQIRQVNIRNINTANSLITDYIFRVKVQQNIDLYLLQSNVNNNN